jgi:putative ABC transport system permease protein
VRAIDRKLWRDLWHVRSQALAIVLVIGAGVAAFVLFLSAYASLQLTQQRYYDQFRFADVFASLVRAPLSLADDLRAVPGVAALDARVVADVTLDVPSRAEPVSGRLISRPDGGRPNTNDVFLASGRDLDPSSDDEILASEAFAHANNLVPGSTLVAVINGRRRVLHVVGLALSPEYVYSIRPGELVADDARFGVLWMNRKALATAFDMEGGFDDVAIRLAPGADERDVIERVDRLLEPYGGFGAIQRSQQLSHFFLQSEIDSLRTMGGILPAIFLAVAAFLMNVVLTRLVAVEREQIAAMKALGYRNSEIGLHYVKWALIVSTVGSATGIVAGALLGYGLTRLYTDFFHFPILEYRLPPAVVASGMAVAAGAAVVGALGAVRRVVTLPPAEAMRPEPPARYRVSWIERAGARRWLSPPARMVLRQLQRRPGRAVMSTVAISFGGALLVVGLFTLDAVDWVIDVQFNDAQRYDAMVTFRQPVSASAAYDVRGLRGVIDAEGFRSVPARFTVGPRLRYVAITGLQASSQLNRIIDSSLEVVRLPPDGLVLSKKLAELLGVRPGDRIEVHVLEGARPVRMVPVVRLVDEYMGTNAYMEIGALHRLMREGNTLSGAFLQVDADAENALYTELKATPAVAGVALTRATLENFQQTLAETVGISRTTTVIFAAIIAFGVVYNTARVALSERGRELATLRVIGLTRNEIASILFGEWIVVTLVALPLGMVIGYLLAAATVSAFNTDVYRLPLIIGPRTYATSAITVIAAAAFSAAVVRLRLNRLDLIAVLKTRE